MPRQARNPQTLSLLLQTQGPTASGAVVSALGVSRATLSRLVAEAGPAVERIGTARNTRYALRRAVRHLGDQWNVYRIDETGRARVWGELRALHGGFRFAPQEATVPEWMVRDYPDGIFPGLPFFLQDARPQGYVGRALARNVSTRLGLPANPERWSDDEVLSWFIAEGLDLTGDIVVGDRALEQALRHVEGVRANAIAEDQRENIYPACATAAQRGELVGSSAGGEQPKFLANVSVREGGLRSVLVKFSSADASPVSQRWADLLCCEHLAAETLCAHSIPCSRTQLLAAGGRRFLEVVRYDRPNAIGRRGVVTLGAIEDAIVPGTPADWIDAARRFEAAQVISQEDAKSLQWRWCFGDLIGNTDMHRANVSFWLDDGLPFSLAPSYDMLPMLFAPGAQGDLSEREFYSRPPLPPIAGVWADAAVAAGEFWSRVSTDERISAGFRVIAARCMEQLQDLRDRYG
ncbi:MAG TPA: type II toxin-antitoxin system HipA family toxin YjjJ [Opitutaceae bacterium]